jgi:ribonuclease P protein subunit POP4
LKYEKWIGKVIEEDSGFYRILINIFSLFNSKFHCLDFINDSNSIQISIKNIKRQGMITPQNLFQHELIGLNVEIIESPNKGLIGIKGKVVDETRNTIRVEVDDGQESVIPKNVAIFHFQTPKGYIVEIDGQILVSRPEDRIKKKFRKI